MVPRINSRALLVIGDSTKHLGLFDDLMNLKDIDILQHPSHKTILRKSASRISPFLLLKHNLLEQKIDAQYKEIFILDTALARINYRGLLMLRNMSNEVRLLVLNSIHASSPTFDLVRPKLSWFERHEIISFDLQDAKEFGFQFLGYQYYSTPKLVENEELLYDAYFMGGLKGGRSGLILDTYRYLSENGVLTRFDCSTHHRNKNLAVYPGINWSTKGWFPYQRALEGVSLSRCVIEILQQGQNAQSLRYFEAVSQNKLLLTNNINYRSLPYYNEKYIRYFSQPESIDLDWLRKGPLPQYHYHHEFSPLNLRYFKPYTLT